MLLIIIVFIMKVENQKTDEHAAKTTRTISKSIQHPKPLISDNEAMKILE